MCNGKLSDDGNLSSTLTTINTIRRKIAYDPTTVWRNMINNTFKIYYKVEHILRKGQTVFKIKMKSTEKS